MTGQVVLLYFLCLSQRRICDEPWSHKLITQKQVECILLFFNLELLQHWLFFVRRKQEGVNLDAIGM